jgi:hypothetical protein
VNDFVEECRREWKRLRVPDPIANEMAADLEADLKEAEAEGASAEEVLGSGAFDPRSFAASWAAERGVAQSTAATESKPMPRLTPRRRLGILTTLAAAGLVGLVILVGAAVALGSVRSSRAVAGPVMRPGAIPHFPRMGVGPFNDHVAFSQAPFGFLVLLVLLVGIVGLTLAVLFWRRWDHSGRWSRPRHDRDRTPEGHYS